MNLTHEFATLGFEDNIELYNILNLPIIIDMNQRAYYLERMGRVYINLLHPEERGAERLLSILKKKPRKKTVFSAKIDEAPLKKLLHKKDQTSAPQVKDDMYSRIDKL